MINYMLMKDAKQFSLIYLIFLCSFAQSIFFTNYDEGESSPQSSTSPIDSSKPAANSQLQPEPLAALWLLLDWLATIVASYLRLWLELFKMTLGVYEFQPFRRSLLSRGLLMLFIQLIPILFNM